MNTVAFVNLKGGVGKTSSCFHLAGALAAAGRRVLLVDADPQASLSRGFWGPDLVDSIDPAETVLAIFAGGLPLPSRVARPSGLPGLALDVVPGCKALKFFNIPDHQDGSRDQRECLREFLAGCRPDYDLVMIDCPPNLHLCSYAALVAADGVVVPLQPEDFGAQGIADVAESIELVRREANPALALLGYLLTMTSREAVHATFAEILREQHGDDVFAATMPRLAGFKEATARRLPAEQFKPKAAPAKAARLVAEELAARADARLAAVAAGGR